MPKFAANLTMLFTEHAFLDRFEHAAKAGFKAVEFLFPYAFNPGEIKRRLDANGLQLVLHNLPAGNWAAGERGIACHPDRVSEFREGVEQLAATMEKYLPRIGHIQLADNPGHHDRGRSRLAPGTGQVTSSDADPNPIPTTSRIDSMTSTSLKIGFIGLGIMGAPMAGHLFKAGHQLFVYTLGKMPQEIAEGRATKCLDAKGVALRADIIITMVPDTPDVAEALFGESGVAKGLTAGKIVVDMSSISPVETKQFAQKIEALGCDYLDAPVSGGDVGAKNAALSIMVGGKPAVFERVKPVFELMGKNITLVGGSGDGQTCKVANQIVVALTINAVAEGLLFAAKAGADPAKVRSALMGGLATSRILDILGERMIKRTFDPGLRIALHQKDLNLALGAAKSLGLALPATSHAQQLFSACVAHGGAAWDHSGMVRALEKLSNFEIGQKTA